MQDFIVGLPRCNEPRDVLAETFRAILASSRAPRRVLIVDNGDEELSDFPGVGIGKLRVDVIQPERNLGCAGSWNLIQRLTEPTPAILLNADLAVAPDTFERILMSAAPVVLAYWFGCFRVEHAVWRSVGPFDEEFYPVYFEDTDYRRRLRLASVDVEEWPTTPEVSIYPGRQQAPTGIVHGKHDPDGYQGWRGSKLAWFHERLAANRAYYLRKWGEEEVP